MTRTRRPSRRSAGTARAAVGVLVLLVLGSLTGCLALPVTGPVRSASRPSDQAEPEPTYYDPPPPQPGATQAQVVAGFLDAMQATPVGTGPAREYLARAVRDSWDPEQTVTYADAQPPRGGRVVRLGLTSAHLLDARGAWRGDLGDVSYTFGVVREDGEYRISAPPGALIVPESWYEQRFRQVALYFFDPTGQILVPEPVFVPEGQQLASTLVSGLLSGPPSRTVGYELSFFPAGLTAGLSVPVSREGVADIALVGGGGVVGAQQAELLLAQLTTTLRQDPSITGVRVSIDGRPLDLPGGATTVPIERGAAYAPYVAGSSGQLFALRDGVLLAGTPRDLDTVRGPFGTTALGIRSVVPDVTGAEAAAVTADGTAVLLGPVNDSGTAEQVISGASDLLPPAWDFSGRLWLVDRTARGALVLQRQGARARALQVPGISSQDVRRLLVSRDGSRLVAVVHDEAQGDRVLVSRVLHDSEGHVSAATPAVRIDEPSDGPGQIADLAWRSPVDLTVLTRVNDALFQVRSIAVDGAPDGLGTLSTTIRGDYRALVGSPAPGETSYAVGTGVLLPLTGDDPPARAFPSRPFESSTIATDPAVTSYFYAG